MNSISDVFFKFLKANDKVKEFFKLCEKSYLDEETLEQLIEFTITTNDPLIILKAAQDLTTLSKSLFKKLVQAIIETKDAEYIYYFARDVEGAPIDDLARAIIETKEAEYIYYFARYVEEAPIDDLARAIIETKNAECIFYFANYVDGAPIIKLNSIREYQEAIENGVDLYVPVETKPNNVCQPNLEQEDCADVLAQRVAKLNSEEDLKMLRNIVTNIGLDKAKEYLQSFEQEQQASQGKQKTK